MLREDFLPDYDLTVAGLAETAGLSRQSVNELLRERRALSSDMALRLARLFGNSAEFWMNAQRALDLWDAANAAKEDLARIKPLRVDRGAVPSRIGMARPECLWRRVQIVANLSWRMSRRDKLLMRILRGGFDANIGFDELRGLLRSLGFVERTQGSHHLFIRAGIEDLINLQRSGSHAKRYQVRQVRAILQKYRVGDDVRE